MAKSFEETYYIKNINDNSAQWFDFMPDGPWTLFQISDAPHKLLVFHDFKESAFTNVHRMVNLRLQTITDSCITLLIHRPSALSPGSFSTMGDWCMMI